MQIAFHIGANCTDEDRLLKSILKNATVLGEQRIRAPGPGKYRRILRETIDNLDGAPPAPNTRQILLDAILDGDTPDRLVMADPSFLSVANDVFAGGALYAAAEFRITSLANLFAEDDIELFLALRNPATFLPETFAGARTRDFDTFLQGLAPQDIRWSDLVRRIRACAPQVPLTVWCNEDTPLLWAQLIRDICGLDPMTRITGGFDLLASIMSPEGMNRFLNYLRGHPPQTEGQKHRIIAAFLDKYALPDQIEDVVDLPGMTGDRVDHLSDLYDEDTALIAGMPDVDFIAP